MGLPDIVRRILTQILFESTSTKIISAAESGTLLDAFTALTVGPDTGSMLWWMDIMVLLSITLIILTCLNCACRCCCWCCISMPLEARKVNRMQRGEMGYQKEAAEQRKTKGNEKDDNLNTEFQSLSKAIVEMQGMIQQTEDNLKKMKNPFDGMEGDQPSTGGEEDKEPTGDPKKAGKGKRTTRTTRTAKPGSNNPRSCARLFPSVDILLSSPNHQYLALGCLAKKKTLLMLQKGEGETGSILAAGKAIGKLTFPHVTLEEMDCPLPSSVNRMEIYSARFTPDVEHTTLVAAERNTDSFFVFSVSGYPTACSAQFIRTIKMPNRRLVSSLPNWSVLSSSGSSVHSLLHFEPKGCEVEVLSVGDTNTMTSDKCKLSVGNGIAWGSSQDWLAVGGSFMREPRLQRVEVRKPNQNAKSKAELKSLATLQVDPTTAAEQRRVLATTLVRQGVPSFNTRNYWIVFLEGGECRVYSLKVQDSTDSTELVCTFHDTDFAVYSPDSRLRLLTAVQGGAYKEKLILVLVQGKRVSVWHQRSVMVPFEMRHVQDISLDSDVEQVEILLNGDGLACCGLHDYHGVQLFEIAE